MLGAAQMPLNSGVRPFMEETRATEGKRRALETRLAAALKDTPLTLLSAPENGAASGMALLSCGAGHQFQRAASSILKWRSDRCPFCYSANAKARQAEKLPDPNNLSWLPEGIRLGKGTKPRDLRDQRFGALVARRAIGKHSSGSLLWECECDCGSVVVKKSSALCLGKAKSCGCVSGTTKKYKTVAPNKGKRYTMKASHEVFASRKAWGEAVKLARGDKCEICGWCEASCDVHHLIERHRGGKNTVENSIVLCPNHHRIAHENGLEYILALKEKSSVEKGPNHSLKADVPIGPRP